jgi:hypothetical protein
MNLAELDPHNSIAICTPNTHPIASAKGTTPDHKKGHHEPLHFAFYHYISTDFRSFLPNEVVAQTTAKDLVGTWTLVSVTLEQDGKKSDFWLHLLS